METLLGMIVGVGLSAACGFRVFVPMLGMSIAAMTGHIHLASGFGWIGTWPALIAFSTAAVVEVGAYYIPWIDNLLDVVTTPAAIVAGTILTASTMGDASPFFKWSLAAIAGGGVAGVVQLSSAAARGVSTASTGGAGNFVVSTLELLGAVMMTILAVLLPLVGFIALIFICYFMIKKFLVPPVSGASGKAEPGPT